MTNHGLNIDASLPPEQIRALVNPDGLSLASLCESPPQFMPHRGFREFVTARGLGNSSTSMWTAITRPLMRGYHFDRLIDESNMMIVDVGRPPRPLMISALRMATAPVANRAGLKRTLIDPNDPQSWERVATESVEVNLIAMQALLAQCSRKGSKLERSFKVGPKTVSVWARFCHQQLARQLAIDGLRV